MSAVFKIIGAIVLIVGAVLAVSPWFGLYSFADAGERFSRMAPGLWVAASGLTFTWMGGVLSRLDQMIYSPAKGPADV